VVTKTSNVKNVPQATSLTRRDSNFAKIVLLELFQTLLEPVAAHYVCQKMKVCFKMSHDKRSANYACKDWKQTTKVLRVKNHRMWQKLIANLCWPVSPNILMIQIQTFFQENVSHVPEVQIVILPIFNCCQHWNQLLITGVFHGNHRTNQLLSSVFTPADVNLIIVQTQPQGHCVLFASRIFSKIPLMNASNAHQQQLLSK
jgi:hypothetical protein